MKLALRGVKPRYEAQKNLPESRGGGVPARIWGPGTVSFAPAALPAFARGGAAAQ